MNKTKFNTKLLTFHVNFKTSLKRLKKTLFPSIDWELTSPDVRRLFINSFPRPP